MTRKVFRAIFIVAMAILCFSFLFVFSVLYQYFRDQYYKELENEAYYIQQGLDISGDAYLDRIENTGMDAHRVTWIAEDGTVLYDSKADETSMMNHADREEFTEALLHGEGNSSRYSATLAETTLYYAKRLDDGTVLRVSATQNSVVTLVLGMLYPVAIVLMVAFVLSMFLAWRVSKRIIKPLNEINLEHPEQAEMYEELVPMLTRIAKQNQQIRHQMKELSHRRDEFETITENMTEGLLLINPQMEILSYNKSVLKMLGAQGITDGQNAFTLSQDEVFRQALTDALNGKQDERIMSMGSKKLQLMVNPVYHGDKMAGAVMMILDVTEREEREQLRREFTANVSHELKTPLTSISGFAEIIKGGIVRPEDVPHFAGKIYEESRRLMSLVEDIMRLSQLDENRIMHVWEAVDLEELIRDCVSRLQPVADMKKIEMKAVTEPVCIKGVRSVLDEVIYNLVDNAIKYNKVNGEIVITLMKGEKTILSVRDTGIGIPHDEQGRVFERFYRVDKSHSKEIGGTGLGLSIVKHGIAYHGASVNLQSEPGQGTVVTVMFEKTPES